MNTKIFYLPCFVYAFSFAMIVLLYNLGWSSLFPELDSKLLGFLLFTILISLALGLTQYFSAFVGYQQRPFGKVFIKRSAIFVGVGYCLDFLYERSIPLLSTFVNPSYSYADFNGIPTLHALLSTYSIFFSIAMFDHYYSERSKERLFHFLLTLLPFILIMNRGAFMIIFFACCFIILMRLRRFGLKSLLAGIALLTAVLFLFGVVGNIRQEQTKADKDYLLRIGGATDKFLESSVPNEYYWSYIYIVSPIGNLQNLMNEKSDQFDSRNVGQFISTQLFPDFVSKRLAPFFMSDYKQLNDVDTHYLVTPLLNAPTTYFTGYRLVGSIGMYMMFAAMMLSAIIYPRLISLSSNLHVTAVASLNAILLLSTFNNMWYAIGTILLWPLALTLIRKIF